ncbi:MAG: pyridoxal phosphate-dependent aminotransferase [Vicinamibacteraceae bacterium]
MQATNVITRESTGAAGACYQMPANEHHAVMLHLNENLFLDEASEQALVREAMLGDLHRYPPGGDYLLRQAIGEACGISPDAVLPSAGATHAIQHLLLRFVPVLRTVVLPSPTWSFYAACTAAAGGEVVEVPLRNESGWFEYDLPALDRLLTAREKALVIVPTPNNPTGHSLPYDDLRRLALRHPRCLFMIDEAYFGFGDRDLRAAARHLQQLDNAVVIRSFSKAYGLAGLRCGFVLAPGAIRQSLAGPFLPFGLPLWVQRIAAARLRDASYLSLVRVRCRAAQRALRQALRGCRTVRAYVSDANFCLVRTTAGKAAARTQALAAAGYVVKQVSHRDLRITLANPDVMRSVARVLRETEDLP